MQLNTLVSIELVVDVIVILLEDLVVNLIEERRRNTGIIG